MAPELLCTDLCCHFIYSPFSPTFPGWLFVLYLNSLPSLNEVIVFQCTQCFQLFVFFIIEVMLSNLFAYQSRNWKSGRQIFDISASKRPITLFIFPLQELLTWPYLNTNGYGAYSPCLCKILDWPKSLSDFSITPYEKP